MTITEAIAILDTTYNMFSHTKTGYRLYSKRFDTASAEDLYKSLDIFQELRCTQPTIKDLIYCFNHNTIEAPSLQKTPRTSSDPEIQSCLELLLSKGLVYFQNRKGCIELRIQGNYSNRDPEEEYKNMNILLNRFPTLKDFTYCFNRNLLQVPTCIYCGEVCNVIPGGLYSKTCGATDCVNRAHEDFFEKKFGVKHFSQTDIFKQKISETAANRSQEDKDLRNKRVRETKRSRYGSETYNNSEKGRRTLLERTGYDSPIKNPETKQKIQNTLKERTGYTNPTMDPGVITKRDERYFNKTGYRNPSQNPEVCRKKAAKYLFDNIYLDSSYEIAVYYHYKKLGIALERLPDCNITYTGEDNKEHYYRPDFRHPDGHYIECKSKRFLRGDNYLTIIQTNAEVISDLDGSIIPYLEEARADFGGSSTWYQQFKTSHKS